MIINMNILILGYFYLDITLDIQYWKKNDRDLTADKSFFFGCNSHVF